MDNTTNTKVTSWKQLWSMPGGTFAKFTAVGAAIGLGYGFFKALPMLIAGAANTLIFIAELIAIAGILMILTSKNFWKWVSLFWLQLNRKIVGMFVKIDPISILEQGIYELKKKYDIVCDNVTKLGGILKKMKNNLKKYQDEVNENINRRNATQKALSDPNISPDTARDLKLNYVNIGNDLARLDKIIESQKKRIETSEKYLNVMKSLKSLTKAKIKDSESEMRFRKEEYEAAVAQNSAIKSIKSIMSGGLSKSLEEELALNYITETVNYSLTEMNELLDGSNDLLVNYELDSMANLDKIDEIIAKYENKGYDSFTSAGELPEKSATVTTFAKDIKVAEPVSVSRSYFN